MFENLEKLYAQENIIIREKAKTLLFLDGFLAVGFLGLGVIRLADGYLMLGGLEIVVSLLLAAFCILILRGRFRAVSIGTVILFGVAASGLFLLREVEGVKDIYIHSSYMVPAFLTLPLLAYKNRQVLGALVFGLLSHVLHNYVRIVPTVRAAGGVYESSEFLVSFLLMIFSSMFIFQIFRLQNQNLRAIEKNAQEAQRSYRQLRNVLDRSAESFNVGERLWKYSRSNAQVAKTISEHLQEMQTEMEKLDENAAATRSGHDQILDKKEAVQRSMDRQTETIQDASASIEQIGSQVERTLTTTERKRAEVENLVQTADHAGGQINGTLESFHAISETSARIIEVIRVIEDVADRTNLLAMNAAIEAAHAGQAGRGFAIVASEIRGLAEETNEHSRTIRETMDQNRQLVEKAVREGDQLHAVFDEIRDKISGVQQSLLETIKGTSQLRSGHSQLQEVVKNLTLVNETVNESLETMDKNLLAGTESVSHIASAITEVRQKLNKLVGHTEEIIEVSSKLKEMGRENVDSYTNLQQEIGQIRN